MSCTRLIVLLMCPPIAVANQPLNLPYIHITCECLKHKHKADMMEVPENAQTLLKSFTCYIGWVQYEFYTGQGKQDTHGGERRHGKGRVTRDKQRLLGLNKSAIGNE